VPTEGSNVVTVPTESSSVVTGPTEGYVPTTEGSSVVTLCLLKAVVWSLCAY
jgi:hypothetical protein